MTDTRKVTLGKKSPAAAALDRAARQRVDDSAAPPPASTSTPVAGRVAPSTERVTTSTRIDTSADAGLRELAEGKRWGRWIEHHLRNLMADSNETLSQGVRRAIEEEDAAIDLVDRKQISLRLSPSLRADIDSFAASLNTQTAVALRHMLHLVHHELNQSPNTN